MQFNEAQRQIVLKVVYYGPPLSGKTTNLLQVHRLLDPRACGRLTSLNTSGDRTLFFDLLPVTVQSAQGYSLKLKLFTVPGQVVHSATRRIVLAGADGVVFVADSQSGEAATNDDSWRGMQHALRDIGIDPQHIPTVVQFNKRDLPNIRSDAELDALRAAAPHPILGAVAVRGDGVLETLHALLQVLLRQLDAEQQLAAKYNVQMQLFLQALFGRVLPQALA